jgi:hypothetical protein
MKLVDEYREPSNPLYRTMTKCCAAGHSATSKELC